MKLTTHLHLLLRSKNEYSYTITPPIRFHGVVVSLKKGTGTTLPSPLRYLDKPIVTQLVKKCPPPSPPTPVPISGQIIKSIYSHPISLRSVPVLLSDLPHGLFPLGFRTKISCTFVVSVTLHHFILYDLIALLFQKRFQNSNLRFSS
jgi:hypothetical protein